MSVAEPYKYIKVLDCVNTIIVTHESVIPPEEARIEKVDDGHYRVKRTGEVREYKPKSETKGDNTESLLKSFARLKALINCNYNSPEDVRFITLTYAENMTDNSRLSGDLQYFLRKMKQEYGAFEYIYVKESQKRGAWHIHMIAFFKDGAPYMPNETVRNLWGHGFEQLYSLIPDS